MFDEERVCGGDAGELLEAKGCVGDWREIDRRMRRVATRRAALDAEEARLLIAAKRAEVHKHLGYGTFDEYLERVLGYAPTTARDKLRVAQALQTLPATAAALASGALSYSAVREITRIATPDTEEDWVVHVEGMTVREIEQCVRCHEPGDGPDDREKPDLAPRVVRMELPPQTYALFLEARRALEREVGHSMTDAELMGVLCRDVISGARVVATHPEPEPAEAPVISVDGAPRYQIAISVCPDCRRGWHDTPGTSVELPPSAIERARCDAVELGRVDAADALPARVTQSVAPRRRRAVLARDRHRCAIPGCRSSRYLEVHHIRHREDGGTDEVHNLVTLCGLHHDLHHDGVIHIDGVPGALRVTHRDGRSYGAPPGAPRAAPTPDANIRAARRALVDLGFRAGEAERAVEGALAHVGGDDAPLEARSAPP